MSQMTKPRATPGLVSEWNLSIVRANDATKPIAPAITMTSARPDGRAALPAGDLHGLSDDAGPQYRAMRPNGPIVR